MVRQLQGHLLTLNITKTVAVNAAILTTDVLLFSNKLESVHSTSLCLENVRVNIPT